MAEKEEPELPAVVLERLATYPMSFREDADVIGLLKLAYAAGLKAKLGAAQQLAIESAVEEELEELWGILADDDSRHEIGRLIEADPDGPTLAEPPYDRIRQVEAICRAVASVLQVTT